MEFDRVSKQEDCPSNYRTCIIDLCVYIYTVRHDQLRLRAVLHRADKEELRRQLLYCIANLCEADSHKDFRLRKAAIFPYHSGPRYVVRKPR